MLTALYKRELGSFFFNYSAYFIFAVYMVFSLVFAVFVGMYFVVDNPAMRSYFAFQPLVLSVTLPAVTGRLWSEKAKTGTLEALLTLPADDLTLVFGKFAAAWTMGGLMTLTSVPLALLTAGTVAVDPLNLASAYFGALLAAAALSALGCAVSCLIPLPAAAYLVSVFFGWLLIFFNPAPLFSPLAGVWPEMPFYLPSALDFFFPLSEFYGRIFRAGRRFLFRFSDRGAAGFQLGGRLCGKEGKMKRRSAILLAGALLALLFVIANLLVSRLVGGRQLDATASGRYTLTEESLKTVAALRQPVTIRLYVSEKLQSAWDELGAHAARTTAFLARCVLAAPDKIRLEIRRIKPFSDMEKQAVSEGMLPFPENEEELYFGLKVIAADGRSALIPALKPERRALLESDLNRILHGLNEERKVKIGVFSPRLPFSPDGKGSAFASLAAPFKEYYEVFEIPAGSSLVPQDIECCAGA